jgi:hypothetical protein
MNNSSTTFAVKASDDLRKEVAKFCRELGLTWNKELRGYEEISANAELNLVFEDNSSPSEAYEAAAKDKEAVKKGISLTKDDPNFECKLNFIRSTKSLWFNNKANRWFKKKAGTFVTPSLKPTNEFEAQVLTYIAS